MSTEKDLVAKCPECSSTFRLTQQHLEAAKGWVQCGMCGHVFHSGIKPATVPDIENAPSSTQGTIGEGPAETVSAEGNEEFLPEEQIAADVSEPEPETPAAAGPEAAAGLSGLSHRMAEQGVPSNFGPKLESIILVDPNAAEADDDYGPMPDIPPTQDTGSAEVVAPPAPASFTPAPPPPGGWGARHEKTATSTGWIPRRAPPPARTTETKKIGGLGWLWAIIILILLAALGSQLFYFLRDKIAANYPESRPYLAQMCDALGCTLSLPKDVTQVLILGSDLQTENENNMALEVTLANRAAHIMAWPVLELTLTDVEDQPIARRMFAPSEYLPSKKMEAAGIQAKTEIPLLFQLQSKGLKAAGYRLRMFY